ncbi:MAG: glycine cleavage system aminomethyltransferase GcvT [Pseudomonadota bacterium]
MKKTPLHDRHVAAGGKMVDFAGWSMPLNYGSQIEEHKQVRADAGQFDVSHMTVVDVTGAGATDYLRGLVANDVAKLKAPGRALYGALLNEAGGVVDDLIVYRRTGGYRLVVNAGTRDKVIPWLQRHLTADAEIAERQDLAIVAVQGPRALERAAEALPALAGVSELRPFRFLEADEIMAARTGYTGEDGVELILPNAAAVEVSAALEAAGVPLIGLAARDTLRLEAGLNLYGQDMDDAVSPLAANLGWTISWQPGARDFIGRASVTAVRDDGDHALLVGVVLRERGVLRAGQEIETNAGPGVLTSGAFAPSLGYSIAFARVPSAARGEARVTIRGRELAVTLVSLPFVRRGDTVYQPL